MKYRFRGPAGCETEGEGANARNCEAAGAVEKRRGGSGAGGRFQRIARAAGVAAAWGALPWFIGKLIGRELAGLIFPRGERRMGAQLQA